MSQDPIFTIRREREKKNTHFCFDTKRIDTSMNKIKLQFPKLNEAEKKKKTGNENEITKILITNSSHGNRRYSFGWQKQQHRFCGLRFDRHLLLYIWSHKNNNYNLHLNRNFNDNRIIKSKIENVKTIQLFHTFAETLFSVSSTQCPPQYELTTLFQHRSIFFFVFVLVVVVVAVSDLSMDVEIEYFLYIFFELFYGWNFDWLFDAIVGAVDS